MFQQLIKNRKQENLQDTKNTETPKQLNETQNEPVYGNVSVPDEAGLTTVLNDLLK